MRLALLLSIFLAATAPVVEPRDAYADSDKPPVSIIAARKVALARAPGTIVNEKLKKKKQQPPIWSIKIRPRGVAAGSDQLIKVEIDGNTGVILKVKDVKTRKSDDD